MFLNDQRSFPASLLYRDAALPSHEYAVNVIQFNKDKTCYAINYRTEVKQDRIYRFSLNLHSACCEYWGCLKQRFGIFRLETPCSV